MMSVQLSSVTLDLPVYSVHAKSLRRKLTSITVGGALFRRPDDIVSVRAVDNVSLEIPPGERVGLIGPNGAGKTTLLKIMAGIYTPSAGSVAVDGRISAALNVGLGLDGELSGRENIYLLAYYRGINRKAVEEQIEQIIAATELGTFIDLPVNTYSAGMGGRLTFAVATAFDPEVLLMDEWFMAGDARFMSRAADRIANFVRRAKVVVLASHSNAVIREFCTSAAYLKAGKLIAFGPVNEVLDLYESAGREASELAA